MSSKTKALLLSVLILPTTVAASTISNMQQNNRQLQVEQIQEETALYEPCWQEKRCDMNSEPGAGRTS